MDRLPHTGNHICTLSVLASAVQLNQPSTHLCEEIIIVGEVLAHPTGNDLAEAAKAAQLTTGLAIDRQGARGGQCERDETALYLG